MRNTLVEKQLLQSIQQSYEIRKINDTSHDIKYIIENMTTMEPEPPDFICGENNYIEHFEVTAYKREKNKAGRLSSIHLAHEAQMKNRANSPQGVFSAAHYSTPDNRTNTRYLKENVDAIILEKTQKQEEYGRKCPRAVNRHLLIELKSRCEIILGRDGQYLDSLLEENERQEALTEFYEIYRDLNFMKTLKEKYSNKWDLLFFVEEFHNYETHIFYVYCFDLKEDIVLDNMKDYPYKLFQIIIGSTQTLCMKGGISVTNISYNIDTTHDDTLRGFFESYRGDTIMVNEIPLYKSRHDSIYMTRDKGLQFETSQLAFAINPDVNVETMVKYIPLLLKEILFLICQGTSITLGRITFIGTYFYQNGTDALFRIDDEKSLSFKLNCQE